MWRTLVHFPFHKILHERNCFIYPQHRDIYREVVSRCNSPFLIRIIIVVGGTRLVCLHHQFLRLFDRQALTFDDPLNAVLFVVVDKETQAVGIITQDIISTPSDNHTTNFLPRLDYGSYRSDTETNGR